MNYSCLLKKYNVPGPRYTSYPTVPYWDKSPSVDEWIIHINDSLSESESKSMGAALYIHIPFCEALCTYCGCNTRITRNRTVGMPYVQTVLKELDLYLKKLGRSNSGVNALQVSEIHLGGGTPTFLTPTELEYLLDGILNRVKITQDAEFSVEADPRVTTSEHLKVLREKGFRRLSLGIQDFDPKVQEVVHRIQSEMEVRRIVESAREFGYTSLNFDLIYGLPYQTKSSIEETVNIVKKMRPDRIAFYAYAHVPWIKPSHRRFTENDLPSGDEKRSLYELGRSLFESDGYHEVGMDHFALKTDSLWLAAETKKLHRNFMGYISRQVSPLIGLGVSSIGDSWNAFAQNEKVLETYQEKVANGIIPIHRGHVLNDEDRILRRHILNLMTRFETDWSDEHDKTPYTASIPQKLLELSNDGLVELSENSCRILPQGRAFLRNICMAFDARLAAKAPNTELFSKTI